MSIVILSHPDCLLHDTGLGHPERSDRIKVIQEALTHYPFSSSLTFLDAPLASREQLIAVHTADYIDWLFSIAPKKNMINIDEDTRMNLHTLRAALRSAGAVIEAVDLIMRDEAKIVFCNVRPPGHHAEKDRAMGFCFFNNVAVGVAHALNVYALKRIAIVDFDVHHGNGTQNIFQNEPRVLYCSSFQHPFYPGYDEELDNEHLLNVPLPSGTDSKVFRELVANKWFDRLKAFQPELVFFSAGFDAHHQDPLAEVKLKKEDYVWITEQVVKLTSATCRGFISVLEGGYHLEALTECVPPHIDAMNIK